MLLVILYYILLYYIFYSFIFRGALISLFYYSTIMILFYRFLCFFISLFGLIQICLLWIIFFRINCLGFCCSELSGLKLFDRDFLLFSPFIMFVFSLNYTNLRRLDIFGNCVCLILLLKQRLTLPYRNFLIHLAFKNEFVLLF